MSMRKLISKYGRRLDLAVEPIRPRKVTVTLNGHTSGFFAYTVGDRFLWVDYEYPGCRVEQYYDCETRARFSVNGEECLELHSDFYEKKGNQFRLECQSDEYVAVRKHEVAELLWVHRETEAPDGEPTGNIQIRDIVTPRKVRLGDRWEFTERWFWKQAKDECHITETADGLFLVRLFGREHQTIRIRSLSQGTRKCHLADSYVALDSGLSVFFRRYNGPGWGNLQKLKTEEQVVVDGTAFYHWYDSAPFRD